MFGIGMTELLLIAGLALIVIGPQKLPQLAKSLGRGLAEFKRATQELKSSIELEAEEHSRKTQEELVQKGSLVPPAQEAPAEEPPAPAEPEAAPKPATWMTESDISRLAAQDKKDEATPAGAEIAPEQDKRHEG